MRDSVMIIGSGMMGSAIGAMAALSGHKTILVDTNIDKAQYGRERAISCVKFRQDNELETKDTADGAIANLDISDNVADASERAFLVIEAVVEDLSVKQNVFEQLDTILPPEVPICSNTSGLRISEIAARCRTPERTLTTHFWLPAHLIPLVEVVVGEKSDLEVANGVIDELKRWKKAPVLVRHDLPGQLANRIFQAIIREAVSIVASGLATAEDVDTAIGCGMALRFPVWGPLMHLDAIGLDLGLSVQDSVLPSISNQGRADDYLRDLVASGKTGVKAGQGFYDWKTKNIDEEIARRNTYIVEAVKITEKLSNPG